MKPDHLDPVVHPILRCMGVYFSPYKPVQQIKSCLLHVTRFLLS